uniref:RING-type E3 ubiquitin transferase n=1 Tax=Catharus ustulatus TaxID=91951 RepID=A0A8C3UWW8_CATUS
MASPSPQRASPARAKWNCPICHEASNDIVYVGNCLHQFCRSCIVRWTTKSPSCPLCRQTVHTIIYPAPPNQALFDMAAAQPSVYFSQFLREIVLVPSQVFLPSCLSLLAISEF